MESTQKIGSRDARLKSKGCLSCIRMKVKAGVSKPKFKRRHLTFYSAMKLSHNVGDAREPAECVRVIETRTSSSFGPRLSLLPAETPLTELSYLRAPPLYPPQYLRSGFNVPSPIFFITTYWRRLMASRGIITSSRGYMKRLLKQGTFETQSKQLHWQPLLGSRI